MRKDKEIIFNMRKDDKSYRYIQKETGVSRATLVRWFRDKEWSKHIKARNVVPQTENSRERMIRMNMVRGLILQYKYASVEAEAVEQYKTLKNDPLFWAGLMLYVGNGDKNTKNLIRLNSSSFYKHNIFKLFSQKYLDIKGENTYYSLSIYQNNDDLLCKERWSNKLRIDVSMFRKSQIIRRLQSKKGLQFGIGNTIICSTSLKKKLCKWLSLAEFENFNAVIV